MHPAGAPPCLTSPSIEFHEIDFASLELDETELAPAPRSSSPTIEFHEIDFASLGLDETELAPAPRSSSPTIEFHEIDFASLELDDLGALDPLERRLVPPEWLASPAEAGAAGESLASRADQGPAAERVILEVEVGLITKSNFYAGLDMDVSVGGLFVATYELLPAGTNVLLSFVLPAGREVVTPGQVRWFRDLGGDAAHGMGVAFTALAADDLAAIQRYCRQREPLYYDTN